MSSVLRSVRKRKKSRTLGAVDVIDRAEYADLEVDAKVELIRSLVPLGLMHIEELLDEEVTALAGERYARKAPSVGGRRHGSNPGTVGLAGQRVPIRVPTGDAAMSRGARCSLRWLVSATREPRRWDGRPARADSQPCRGEHGQRPAAKAGAVWDLVP